MNLFFIQKHFFRDVPLSLIRHNDLPCYSAEGFGGAPIDMWPMYTFFRQYLSGEKEIARKNFEDWYLHQLGKYHAVPKSKGGMHRGSLYDSIERKCKLPFAQVSDDCKNAAIRERVLERLGLLEEIRLSGYNASKAERIDGFRSGGLVYLVGGHHRAAALSALGERVLPQVLVFPNHLAYKLFSFLRVIKEYARFQK